MSKKIRRKRLFGAKVLAISVAAVFMVSGVSNLYAEIQSDTSIKKETYITQAVKKNVRLTLNSAVIAEPEKVVTIEHIGHSPKDEYMLAKIAMAEAESEGIEGKALVIRVVLNRVQSDKFPNSISEVIFQRGQFSTIGNGRYDRVEPDQECYEALNLVQLESWDESQGALYFESESTSDWHKNNLHFLFQYRNHYFYTDKELGEWEE